ncbi:hypothetical protein SPLC1_S082630 [Arthrospira platensis C1]|nr:hypothetical protein SPLC1_S082630 [Arthrospira platensis C1]
MLQKISVLGVPLLFGLTYGIILENRNIFNFFIFANIQLYKNMSII